MGTWMLQLSGCCSTRFTQDQGVLFRLDGKIHPEVCERLQSAVNVVVQSDALHLGGWWGHAGEVPARPAGGDM